METGRDRGRIASIDAFRGGTIALMILVNNPGSAGYFPDFLKHAPWHGCTPADLVFPFFLFIMGAAMPLSPGTAGIPDASSLHLKFLRRGLILILLGVLAGLVPKFDFSGMRIFGVLQRIGLTYIFASIITVYSGKRGRAAWAIFLFFIYWLIMALAPFPGRGDDPWARDGNFVQYLDTLLLGRHTWIPGLEPEGAMSTIPSILSVLSGYYSGEWIASKTGIPGKIKPLLITANAMILLSFLIEPFMPVNKQLWTGTFVLVTSGIALNILTALHWLMDYRGYTRASLPLIIFGSNSILMYLISIVFAKAGALINVAAPGEMPVLLKGHIYTEYLAKYLGHEAGSLAWPVFLLLVLFFAALVLHKKRIFIRI